MTNDNGDGFVGVKEEESSISFTMWGHNGIHYRRLDVIRDYCKKNKIDVFISVNEFIENDGGYFYDGENK